MGGIGTSVHIGTHLLFICLSAKREELDGLLKYVEL
jgi:hypothetical protein